MLSEHGYLRLSFDTLYRDFVEILAYVEPCDHNLKTYSQEIYGLFLRTCTELESIFKLVAAIHYPDIARSDRPNISHYRQMETHLGFERRMVGIHFWRPERIYIEPFKEWSTKSGVILPWYQAYNEVKHDKNANLSQANLENLVLSFCGLFQAIIQTNILPTQREFDHYVENINGHSEAIFPKYQLSQADHRT